MTRYCTLFQTLALRKPRASAEHPQSFAHFLIGCALATLLALPALSARAALPGAAEDEGKTVVYRDEWGVPHIYAPTAEAGLYAMGWCQAEDRPIQLLRNLLRGMGEIASVDGPEGIESDQLSRMFDHYGVAKRNAGDLDRKVRKHLEAFVAGIRDYYAAHPGDLPDWWGEREFDIHMVNAFGRIFLYSWSIDDGIGDLERGGVEPGFEETARSSNQFAVGPERSAEDGPILYIDPHLGWFGPSRFWEFRIHAGSIHGSGFTLAGQPYIGLGHNENVAWAMTTGGPDTADVYALTLHADDPGRYLYDGEWQSLEARQEVIEVKGAEPRTVTLYESHHGPIVAMRDGMAYALKTAYAEVADGIEAWQIFNTAEDYKGIVAGLETQAVFPQNVMCADTSGNIYYHRTGRVPERPEGFDWSRPVPGNTSATDWGKLHPQSDLVHLHNPAAGYMQNCNIPPDAMLIDSPLQPAKYKPYIFGDRNYGPRGGWINQRGARAVELLAADDSVTAAEARTYGLDVHPFGSERWIEALRTADEQFGAAHRNEKYYVAGMKDIVAWDQRLSRDSTGALKYFYWRRQLAGALEAETLAAIAGEIDAHYTVVQSGASPEGPDLADAHLQALAAGFKAAMRQLVADFGSLDTVYGDRFRVGRGASSWPSGGGGSFGTRTVRSVSYGPERDDHTQWGRGGQTSTQIVVLGDPIRSWTQPPIGQSDRPDSPHYTDQAEKLYSPREMKPTRWRPEDLEGHTKRRTVLDHAP